MDLFQAALGRGLRSKYPGLRFGERKAHALPIEPGEGLPSFDLVPAFETTTADDDVLIADREDRCWERSNTRDVNRVVAGANQAAGGRLIHVVRMVKHAVRSHLNKMFPGLAVESFAIAMLAEPIGYPEASLRVFEHGASVLGGVILDPTGLDDLAPKIDALAPGFVEKAKEWFEARAADARRARDRALAGQHDHAIAWWFRVFGPPFPLPPDARPEEDAAAALTFGAAAPRPTRSWRSSI